MPADEQYRRQVALLVRILPLVAQEKCFALKGGTAINLFIVYLISHNRPMAEVLAPAKFDLSHEFAHGFFGMTEVPINLDALLQTCEESITEMIGRMPDAHRRFLVSFKKGAPDWSLLDVPHAKTLPAVR